MLINLYWMRVKGIVLMKMLRTICQFALVSGVILSLAACSTLEDWTGIESPDIPLPSLPKFSNPFAKKQPKLPGERIAVMQTSNNAPELDITAATASITLPPVTANENWSQPGGNAQNAPGHLSLIGGLNARWTADAGKGSSKHSRLSASPIVVGGRVYTLDSRGVISAFSQSGGGIIWRVTLAPENENAREGYGGGLAGEGDKIYAATGFGIVAALNPSSGKALWQTKLGEPVRSSPTAANGKIFALTAQGTVVCLNSADGTILWRHTGLSEQASILTNASPAVSNGTVVIPYTSGEIVAFDIESGEIIWSDSLSRARGSSSLASLKNASRPVVANGVVYAVGNGGRMIATKISNGERLWSVHIRSIQAPWVAGDNVYVVDSSGRLLALAASSGKVRWGTNLPGGGYFSGPVLANNRLWLVSSKGLLVGVDAASGVVQSKRDIGSKMTIAPVVARGGMYLLTDKAKLIALN